MPPLVHISEMPSNMSGLCFTQKRQFQLHLKYLVPYISGPEYYVSFHFVFLVLISWFYFLMFDSYLICFYNAMFARQTSLFGWNHCLGAFRLFTLWCILSVLPKCCFSFLNARTPAVLICLWHWPMAPAARCVCVSELTALHQSDPCIIASKTSGLGYSYFASYWESMQVTKYCASVAWSVHCQPFC